MPTRSRWRRPGGRDPSETPANDGTRREAVHARDQALLAQWLAGDASALQQFVEHHGGTWLRLALRVGASDEDARDILQEAYARLLKELSSGRLVAPGAKPTAWMCTVVKRLTLDRLRTAQRRQTDPAADLDPPGGLGPSLEDQVAWLCEQLPTEDRPLFNEHLLDGYTVRELAERHGTAKSTLGDTLRRISVSVLRMLGADTSEGRPR